MGTNGGHPPDPRQAGTDGGPPRVRAEPLDVDAIVGAGRADCGAVATFVGVVRDHHDGRNVVQLTYTAHERIAEKVIRAAEVDAVDRFGVAECTVVHRVGTLAVGDAAIVAVVKAPHRAEAFAALASVVDEVKHRAPIWKEELYVDGSSAFVEGCSLSGEAPR